MELAVIRYSKPVLAYKLGFMVLMLATILFSATHRPASYNSKPANAGSTISAVAGPPAFA